jgi:DNA-binding transcriptional ArsR family regulator
MDVDSAADHHADDAVAAIARAIGEPARARMLYCLMDNRSRTSKELAVVADVSPSTASVHLQRLTAARLVTLQVQGRHRYYNLRGAEVAKAIEALSVLAGDPRRKFVRRVPNHLRVARTCYDHMAGTLGVALHDRLMSLGWLLHRATGEYDLTAKGIEAAEALGVELEEARASRRRFAFPCLDWSERRPHIGGALGAAILKVALRKRWVSQELDSRALSVTSIGLRDMRNRFGLVL